MELPFPGHDRITIRIRIRIRIIMGIFNIVVAMHDEHNINTVNGMAVSTRNIKSQQQ